MMARVLSAFCNGIVLSSRKLSSSTAFTGKEMLEEKEALIKEMKKLGSATSDAAAAPTHWIPDPVTGYYRPANSLNEIDPAELRQKFLNYEKKV
ncbi:late embryogenesis abundant protein Lea5-like [Phalaenopsis equestris]|uniref:late embryogenesis abundant protein Lea5-like n=1 Tax=Phalaenopsis equestris TaxID=78828 RepID=UPI0009E25E8E|nr:late embryogenesis abundant protein Lea5-like [Phalaenopsis equestris]